MKDLAGKTRECGVFVALDLERAQNNVEYVMKY